MSSYSLSAGRDEALAAGDRLLADVVGRDARQVRLRDLDVVAEDPVVANLERRRCPVRARSASSIAAIAALPPRLIARSSSSSASTPSRMTPPSRACSGRLVDDRALDRVADVGEVVDLGHQAGEQRRLQTAASAAQRGAAAPSDWPSATTSRGPAVPSEMRATSRSRSCMLLSSSRSLPRSVVAEREVFDGVEPILNARQRDQRPHQPLPQQPPAHRRRGAIEHVQQRAVAAALRALDDVQMAQRDRIDEQRVGGDAAARCRGRARARRAASRAGTSRWRRRRRPPPARLRGRGRRATPSAAARTARSRARAGSNVQASTRVTRRATCGRQRRRSSAPSAARISRGRSTASSAASAQRRAGAARIRPPRTRRSRRRGRPGPRRRRRAAPATAARNAGSRASRYAASVNVPGETHARDFALDDALGLARVFDLIADRDAVALAHQPREVGVERRDTGTPHIGIAPPLASLRATSASARARATPSARPRRTSRRNRPCGRTRSRRDAAA